MDRLMPRIREIAERISSDEEKRRRVAELLRNIRPVAGNEILRVVKPDPLRDLRVVGVDGGIVKKSLHGFDCMLVRAVGVCFHYRDGKVGKVEYLPSRIPSPEPEIVETLSDPDWAYFTSISRQRMEIRIASECMERFRPDMLMMDGSIVPHYADRPSKSSAVYDNYVELISDCKDLYKKAKGNGISLLGVIEDSRGDSFCRIVRDEVMAGMDEGFEPGMKDILDKTRDTNLLFWTLHKGESSRTFPYSRNPAQHPVLRDFGELGSEVFSFYLKTARLDRPVRVDFLRTGEKGGNEDYIASVLLAISGQHSEYGLPAPLIEADNVAKLSESEINNFYSSMLSLAGNPPSLFRLRREQRPF